MKRILWLSKHRPLSAQMAWLEVQFGEVSLERDGNPFSGAEEITQRFRAGGYDDIVVVAPLWVIAKLTELGIKPLWADMREVKANGAYDILSSGRYYRFAGFRRIYEVKVVFGEI